MKKQIIGYKFKEGFESYSDAALQITKSSKFLNQEYLFRIDSLNCNLLEKAGVLDLWFEPVYEEEYKVGDWIIGWRPLDYVTKLLESRKCGFLTDHVNTQNVKQHISIENIRRKATPEEIKKHLIDVAKNKGIWNVPIYDANGIVQTKYNSHITRYDPKSDGLFSSYGLVYQNGIWAIPRDTSETVQMRCDDGTFELKISKEGIFYEPESAWLKIDDIRVLVEMYNSAISFLKYNKSKLLKSYYITNYKVDVGCKKGTLLSDWKKVYEIYQKFHK